MPGLKQAILSRRRLAPPTPGSNLESAIAGIMVDIAHLESGLAALNDRVDLSVLNALERTSISFNASQRAIDKAEEAQKTYNTSHNDLARKMEEQYNHMLPRAEAQAILTRMAEDIKELRDAQHATGGQSRGMRDMWGWVFAGIMGLTTLGLGFVTLLSK